MAVTTWAPHSPDERSNCIWVHLRQVGDSNAVCVGSSTGHWAVGADGWGACALDSVVRRNKNCHCSCPGSALTAQHGLTTIHREGKWRRESGVGVSLESSRCEVDSSSFSVNMKADRCGACLSTVLSLPSDSQTPSFLSRYLCHTEETNRDVFNKDST